MVADSIMDPHSAIRALSQLPECAHTLWVQRAPNKMQKALSSAAEKIGISEKYLICIISLVIFYTLAGRGTELFFRILSTAYPAYASFKALESIGTENESHQSVLRWLKYWVIFGALGAADFLVPNIIARITSFWLIKSVLVLWCMAPVEPNGSEMIYATALGPYFESLQKYLNRFARSSFAYTGSAQRVAAETIFRAQHQGNNN